LQRHNNASNRKNNNNTKFFLYIIDDQQADCKSVTMATTSAKTAATDVRRAQPTVARRRVAAVARNCRKSALPIVDCESALLHRLAAVYIYTYDHMSMLIIDILNKCAYFVDIVGKFSDSEMSKHVVFVVKCFVCQL
jgi:hypothetical protein